MFPGVRVVTRPCDLGSTPQQHQASMASQPAADGSAGGDYSAYYEQYWYNYHAWQNYAAYNPSGQSRIRQRLCSSAQFQANVVITVDI